METCILNSYFLDGLFVILNNLLSLTNARFARFVQEVVSIVPLYVKCFISFVNLINFFFYILLYQSLN